MRVLVAFFTLCLVAVAPRPAPADAPPPKVVQVGGTVRGKEARVQFRIENAFTPEMVEALKSGIEITFRVRLEVERVHRNWFNVTVGDMKYAQSIRYDVLSRVYRFHRGGVDEIVPDLRHAVERMTRLEATVPLSGEISGGKPYRARVRVRLDQAGLADPLRTIVFFSSVWDVETDWAHGPLRSP
ncbi:MAG: DUF4390 domain-containing protein [Thermodesulfobacteriota bacterium]